MIKEMESDITSIMKNNITIDGEVKWYKIQEKFMWKKEIWIVGVEVWNKK